MILILECGSTKSDWSIISKNGLEQRFTTHGINPSTLSLELLEDHIRAGIMEIKDPKAIAKIFHYGAGVSGKEQQKILESIFAKFLPGVQIEINNDVLAAVRSTIGDSEGIVCILGTGSNSCYFDGEKIAANYNGLGHLIGDEGSGVDLGIRMIKLYNSNSLPREIASELDEELQDRSKFINKLYNHPKPNRYLATFAKFAGSHRNYPVVSDEIKDAFSCLIKNYLSKYPKIAVLPVNFVGSISTHFKEYLVEVMESKGYKVGKIILKPMVELESYHKKDL
ncbi:hypothetical protein [Membranihabitans marinus]|uniref:hypothetical protein n=1 Tax=Membranihabitans marinus TaxID=1227546 RepID=UPI001F31ADB8|nr:hypothetical protein [Membranihabitans marinus]